MWKWKVTLAAIALVALALAGCSSTNTTTQHKTNTGPTTAPAPVVSLSDAAVIDGLGDSGGGVVDIAANDTAVWAHVQDTQKVVRIDPKSNKIVATIQVGKGLGGVAIGDGAIWVLCREDPSVWRINPLTNKVVTKIPLPNSAAAITVTPGEVWIASRLTDTLYRIDSATNRLTATIPLTTNSAPKYMASAGGSVWLCDSGTPQEGVTRVDPATGQVTARIDLKDQEQRICDGFYAYDNSIWVHLLSETAQGDAYVRVDVATNTVTQRIEVDGYTMNGPIVVDAHGLWTGDGDYIYVINTQAGQIVGERNEAGGVGLGLGAGAVWYASSQFGLIRIVATP
jgi:DNA-binding beta-propeller fold protein YncE